MMSLNALFLILWVSMYVSIGADEAKLFFYKSTETKPVVQNRDFVITYKVVNIGDGPAYNIEITDRYDQHDFEMKSHEADDNMITINIGEIAATESHEVNVTVVPLKFGGYVPTLAKIKFSGGADRILDDDDDDDDDDMEGEVDLDAAGEDDDSEPAEPAETGTIGYSTSLGRLEIVEEALFLRRSAPNVWTAVVVYLLSAGALVLLPYSSYQSLKSKRTKSE